MSTNGHPGILEEFPVGQFDEKTQDGHITRSSDPEKHFLEVMRRTGFVRKKRELSFCTSVSVYKRWIWMTTSQKVIFDKNYSD